MTAFNKYESKRDLDDEVHPPNPREDVQRWRCPRGCCEPRVTFDVEVTHVEQLYLPMVDADLPVTFENAVYKRLLKEYSPKLKVIGLPTCRKCKMPVVREGRCVVCKQPGSVLLHYVRPPDFDPEIDDPARPNTCAQCFELLDEPEPPPPKSPEPDPAHVTAELYEQRIRAAGGRRGLRRALLKAARRDHPDDPRWEDFR